MLGGILSCGLGCICIFSVKKLGFTILPISWKYDATLASREFAPISSAAACARLATIRLW